MVSQQGNFDSKSPRIEPEGRHGMIQGLSGLVIHPPIDEIKAGTIKSSVRALFIRVQSLVLANCRTLVGTIDLEPETVYLSAVSPRQHL